MQHVRGKEGRHAGPAVKLRRPTCAAAGVKDRGSAATVYVRARDNPLADFLIEDANPALPEVGISVPLADLYKGVPFPPRIDDAEAGFQNRSENHLVPRLRLTTL
jgi:hypothetical protein